MVTDHGLPWFGPATLLIPGFSVMAMGIKAFALSHPDLWRDLSVLFAVFLSAAVGGLFTAKANLNFQLDTNIIALHHDLFWALLTWEAIRPHSPISSRLLTGWTWILPFRMLPAWVDSIIGTTQYW